uniref:Uncharacterized protein n=1 Tax=Anguilla anguilla TaxID=7936 RepID=A0A0E9Q353_ANGAN
MSSSNLCQEWVCAMNKIPGFILCYINYYKDG